MPFNRMLQEPRESAHGIPSGKELPRTPPMGQVKKELTFASEEDGDGEHHVEGMGGTEVGCRPSNDQDAFQIPERRSHGVAKLQGSHFRRSRIESTVCPATVSSRDPIAMLKGMEGYQLTQTDQDFIQRMNEERLRKHLEGELADLEKALKREAMALDLKLAVKDKALDELKKFPSCEEMADLARAFLRGTLPASELDQMDPRTLLALVEKREVLLAISERERDLVAMEERVRQKEEEAKENQEKRILEKKHEIKGLMIQVANLQLELAQETETCAALEAMAAAPPVVQIKMEDVAVSDVKQEAVVSQPPPRSSRRRSVAAAETSAVSRMPINAASRTLRSQPTNGHQDDQSVAGSGRGRAKTARIASTAASKPIKPAARQIVVTTAQKTLKTGNASTRPAPQKGGKSRDAKPKGGKTRDPEGVASLPAATAVLETAGASEQSDCLRRSKRIASKK